MFAMLFVIVLCTISVSAVDIYKQNENIDLKVAVATKKGLQVTNTTNCNITILDSNNRELVGDEVMTYNQGSIFNYTLTNTSDVGDYDFIAFCANDVSSGFVSQEFTINVGGETVTTAKGILYFGLTALLIFLFFIDLAAITKVPTKDETDDYGMLMSVNKLKYLRPVLMMIAWMLLVAIVFTSSNVALTYIGDAMFGNLLFTIYRVMFALTLPGVVIWFIIIFVNIFRDAQTNKLIERGIDMPGSP